MRRPARHSRSVRKHGRQSKRLSVSVALALLKPDVSSHRPHAIMMKAKRHGWALPSKIQKRVEALQKSVTERAVCEGNRACNDQAVEIIAQSWEERGEQHRALAFNLAHQNSKRLPNEVSPLKTGRAAEKDTALRVKPADSIRRKAPGFQSGWR